MSDLWPKDLPTMTMTSPVTILREQASLLGTKTRNIVKAEVRRYNPSPVPVSRHVASAKPSAAAQEPFCFSFNLVAPVLGNYTYRLFTVAYDVNRYRATISSDYDIAQEEFAYQGELDVSNDAEFKECLSRILGSQNTLKVITALLSQSTDQGNDVDGA
jgi:hypothetical protein